MNLEELQVSKEAEIKDLHEQLSKALIARKENPLLPEDEAQAIQDKINAVKEEIGNLSRQAAEAEKAGLADNPLICGDASRPGTKKQGGDQDDNPLIVD
jgi:hypothetical protein